MQHETAWQPVQRGEGPVQELDIVLAWTEPSERRPGPLQAASRARWCKAGVLVQGRRSRAVQPRVAASAIA
jgi:hypothetical protein